MPTLALWLRLGLSIEFVIDCFTEAEDSEDVVAIVVTVAMEAKTYPFTCKPVT